MPDGLEDVVGDGDREYRLQMRRPLDRGGELGHGEIADAEHADVAVAPWLCGGPFDESKASSRSVWSRKVQTPSEPPVPRALAMIWA